ncbi:uncharacterized protein LOC6532990 isoform X3 [Drosophila yakuba]|uniref:uncharacterized protein LOC6532990 isoform X3 n=1 Tax=Drosophila yakuba TaxID=7245 RepID=UPI0019307C8E|nr:uncharacterized protein LOC6532990 isoform X3 [Drosophila yakuba]
MGNGAQNQPYTVEMGAPRCLIALLACLFLVEEVEPKVEFTNFKCTSLDPKFAIVEHCYLKSVNRTYKYLALKINLLQKPVTRIKVNGATWKRFNGYKPSLYNVTIDACKFLKNPKSNPVADYIHRLFRTYSNMNHSCPFNHDVIIDKLPISFVNNQVTAVLPVPPGDYMFQSHWYAYDINRATVQVYLTIF